MKRILIFAFALLTGITVNSQNKLTPELMWKLGRVGDIQLSPDGNTILYSVTFYDLAANKGNTDLYSIPVTGGNAIRLTDFTGPDFNARWRSDGKKIGYVSAESGETQLWEMNADGKEKKQLTSFPGGINGFDYAPDMKHILVIRDVKIDKTATDIYPDLPKADALIIDDLMYRHWDSWSDASYSHIFVVPYTDGKCGEATDIMSDERGDTPMQPFGGMEQIAWSPDGSKIAYTCKKLAGIDYAVSTNAEIYLYDLQTVNTSTITEGMKGYDMDPVFSPDGKYLIWSSMKSDGYEADKNRIMLYEFTSAKITDLSENFDQSSATFRWSTAETDVVYFISGYHATYQIHSINIKTKQTKMITTGPHDYTELAVGKTGIYGARMSMSQPTELFKIEQDAAGAKEKQLSNTNREILSTISMGKVEERWITTTDNKKMLVWVIYPPDFDATKKYPAILFCEGGPQSAVSQFWSYRWNMQIMAANGYIVIAPNRRGLPTFGQEWNDEIAGDYGGQNMADYLTAVDSVCKDSWVDKNRLGAVGASYGGYSVYWLAGHHNGRFKAFIAHCGMFNLESWYGSTEEYWFPNHDLGGAYWQNPRPKSYDFSPHLFVGNWDTPILVITGGNDFRIPYTESMQAFDAAQLRGIPSRFLFFPNESHFILKPQNSVLWQREFFKWLDRWLK